MSLEDVRISGLYQRIVNYSQRQPYGQWEKTTDRIYLAGMCDAYCLITGMSDEELAERVADSLADTA